MTKSRMVAVGLASALAAGVVGLAAQAQAAWWWKLAPSACTPASGTTLDPSTGAVSSGGTVYCPVLDTSATPKTSAASVTVYLSNSPSCTFVGAARCLHYSWQQGGGCQALSATYPCNGAGWTVSPPQSGDYWQNTGAELGYLKVSSSSGAFQLNGYKVTD